MKTACLSFTCPSCGTPYEIFMKKQPDLMILNCSACKTSVSLYEGQAVNLDNTTLSKIKTAESNVDVCSIFDHLQKITQNKISKDDVINLQIDLAQCSTFDDVLKLVCRK